VVPTTLRGDGVTGAQRSGPCSLEVGAKREHITIGPGERYGNYALVELRGNRGGSVVDGFGKAGIGGL
jgi:hypothetical protein